MKTHCGKCATALHAEGSAYICSYECTFCLACATAAHWSCPNCGGELVRRPRRAAAVAGQANDTPQEELGSQTWLIWPISFAVWAVVALAASGSIYGLYRSRGFPMSFATTLGLELCQILTYAPRYYLHLRWHCVSQFNARIGRAGSRCTCCSRSSSQLPTQPFASRLLLQLGIPSSTVLYPAFGTRRPICLKLSRRYSESISNQCR